MCPIDSSIKIPRKQHDDRGYQRDLRDAELRSERNKSATDSVCNVHNDIFEDPLAFTAKRGRDPTETKLCVV